MLWLGGNVPEALWSVEQVSRQGYGFVAKFTAPPKLAHMRSKTDTGTRDGN